MCCRRPTLFMSRPGPGSSTWLSSSLPTRAAYRWGRTKGKIGFHGGRIEVYPPRVRARSGSDVSLPSWETALAEGWLGQWAMNMMLVNVSTCKFGRAVWLPGGDVPAPEGDGRSKSAVSRRFVALSAEQLAEWMASDLSGQKNPALRRLLFARAIKRCKAELAHHVPHRINGPSCHDQAGCSEVPKGARMGGAFRKC